MKKNILWVEDFGGYCNDDDEIKESIDKYLQLFDKQYRDSIEIKTKLEEGIEYIFDHYGEYDCVILDVDMNPNLIRVNDSETWNKFFDKVNIDRKQDIFNDSGKTYRLNAYLGKYAGFFLVILLKALGFSQDRITMFTAFGYDSNDNRVSNWEKKFSNASISTPKTIKKENGDEEERNACFNELNKHLKTLYAQDYYKTRHFMFKLYNLYEKYEKAYPQQESIFNSCCKKENKKMSNEQVLCLIESVIFNMPCIEPVYNKNSMIYFNMLKQFTEPFEAEFNFKNNNTKVIRVLKLYRNWSSHNLFKDKNKLNSDLFMFLVLIETFLMTDKSNEFEKQMWKEMSFFFDKKTLDCSHDEIIKKIKIDNWERCKKWQEILISNMIDVYDRKSKSKNACDQYVYYNYLVDSYINAYIDMNIAYDNLKIGYSAYYKLSDDCSEIQKHLMCIAYYLYDFFVKTEVE